MTRTMLIGLDGATFTVLEPLMDGSCEEGVIMPFLASVVENGYSATLKSTNHPLTPPAWTTVCTGRTPGHHGVYDFVRFEDMGSDVYFTLYDSRDIRVETFWEVASREDKTVVSLNFPMMAPPPEINGSLVPGFVSWKHLRRRPGFRIPNVPDHNWKFLQLEPGRYMWLSKTMVVHIARLQPSSVQSCH